MTIATVDHLSDEDVASFRDTGFLVLRGGFDAQAMAEITGWVDEVEAWPEAPGKYMKYFEEKAETGARLLNRLENFEPYHAGLADLMNGPLQRWTGDLMGENAALFKDKINFKLPGGGGFEAHQDVQAGWDDYATYFITATVVIDPATMENGCLELAHWPHRFEMVGNLWEPLTDDQTPDADYVAYPCEPGDVLFFDSFLPHRSAPNNTDKARRVLYITYNRASAGDHRAQYYADKRKSYPPDIERDPDKEYAYKV